MICVFVVFLLNISQNGCIFLMFLQHLCVQLNNKNSSGVVYLILFSFTPTDSVLTLSLLFQPSLMFNMSSPDVVVIRL